MEAVRLLGAPAIVTFTRTGGTARLVSSYRPPVPILGVCDDRAHVAPARARLGRARPCCIEGEPSYEPCSDCARALSAEQRHRRKGQRIVVTAGVPFHVPGTTNMLRVEEL